MHGIILAQIFSRLQISSAESLILQIIASAGNVWGQRARLSYDVLAARSGFTARWCMALVARLEGKHLLRVERLRLSYAHHAINVYSVVRPWVKELSIREALQRRQTAQKSSARLSSSEQSLHPDISTREKNPGNPSPNTPASHAECLKAGLTPGTLAYRLARGLPDIPEKPVSDGKPAADR